MILGNSAIYNQIWHLPTAANPFTGKEWIEAIAREIGVKPMYREGHSSGKWILLDYIDVVIHIFHDTTRQFYALEKLWGDAPVESMDDD